VVPPEVFEVMMSELDVASTDRKRALSTFDVQVTRSRDRRMPQFLQRNDSSHWGRRRKKLRRANETLRLANAFFAQAELDIRLKPREELSDDNDERECSVSSAAQAVAGE
jgi:hypothetical protein